MRFEYTYRNTPGDYWFFYIGNVYRQWTAVVNFVFTAAVLALMVSRWQDSSSFFRGLMVFALLIFPVFQPLAIWLYSLKSAERIREQTTLAFEDKGFVIRVKDHVQNISWNDFQGVQERKKLIVLIPDGEHAYLLPDRIVGDDRAELLAFISSKKR